MAAPDLTSTAHAHRAGVVAPTAADATIASELFGEAGIPVAIYHSIAELISAIEEGLGAVVLMEEYFTHPQAQQLMVVLSQQPSWSSIPFVVLTHRSARTRGANVLLHGLPNTVFLERPVAIAPLLSAVRAALTTRARQYEIRDLLLAAQRASEELARLHFEAEEARSAAVAANRMKDEFLAVLSHELRTPLNAILGWTKLLQRGVLDASRTAHAIATIERNCKLQAQLVGDLLDVSRIISGTLRLDVQTVDMVQVIEQALATVAPAAEAKGVRIQKVLDPSATAVSGDPARLQQVVWNLLSNAVKFTPKNGRIQVHLEWADSNVQICVSDTGEGIDAAFLPYVFERFRQADASSTRHHGGLGLGLAIVRQLVELHGGSVSAESAGPGQGSTFKVSLPVSLLQRPFPPMQRMEDTLTQEAENGGSRHPPSLKGLRILVIDDEPESLHVVGAALSHCEAEVLTASSVASGLELFSRCAPNIVICDIGMPREDGFAFARKMRTLEQGRRRWTPAIALTAYARPEDRARILGAGFQVHMVKPVDPFELIAVIAGFGKTVGR